MLKRTTVKFLLAVLVITGLAGTVDDASLTAAEKKAMVKSLKESRDRLIAEYKKFSEKQAHFVAEGIGSADIYLQAQQRWEESAWKKLKSAMRQPVRNGDGSACGPYMPEVTGWTVYPPISSLHEGNHGLNNFKTLRQSGIRYVRNSTENFKTHYVATEAGCVTGYQYLIGIIERTNESIAYLENIRRHPQFPAE